MPYTVSILNTRYRFDVNEDETVLQAALRQDVPLPWGCGGGICGTCMGQVIAGQLIYPEGDPLALFEDDAAAGRGLFCTAHAGSDLVLEIPEIGKVDWEPLLT